MNLLTFWPVPDAFVKEVTDMRTGLQGYEGMRVKFSATFHHYGTFRRRGIVGRTILLKNVRDAAGRLVADHIWINYSAPFDAIGEFHNGEKVSFSAKVIRYLKGYFGENIDLRLAKSIQVDYGLIYPRNVEVIA